MARPVGRQYQRPLRVAYQAHALGCQQLPGGIQIGHARVSLESAHTATTAILPASTSASIWRMAGDDLYPCH